MKKQLILLSATILVAVTPFFSSASEVSELNYAAKFSWQKLYHDFGKIEKNMPVVADFEFTNQGNSPLMIVSVKGSCGCTVANYTKGEIMPGEKGTVTATYNAAKSGGFNKKVTVTANTEGDPIILTLMGEVMN